jgi:hypothetical protein
VKLLQYYFFKTIQDKNQYLIHMQRRLWQCAVVLKNGDQTSFAIYVHFIVSDKKNVIFKRNKRERTQSMNVNM